MNQAEVGKLISQLRIKLQPKTVRVKDHETINRGHRGQLLTLRKSVTAVIQNERVEFSEGRGVAAREYTERLIHEAVINGDKHTATMEMANWWLTDKSLVYKLFQVLVPRFEGATTSYTRMLKVPVSYSPNALAPKKRVILELRGHPFPALHYSNTQTNRGLIHNVLLAEAGREARLKNEFNLKHPT